MKSDFIPNLINPGEFDPNSFLDSCMKEKIRDGVDLILENGGSTNPSFNIQYDDKNISYLCYTSIDYYPCINQQSLLIQHIKKELYNYIHDDMNKCFNEKLLSALDKKGYTVEVNYSDFEIDLKNDELKVDINAELTLTKNDVTTNQANFSIVTPTRLYNLAVVAREIVDQEIIYCYFSDMGYNIMHPEIRVRVNNIYNAAKIYTVEDVTGDEKFWFAVRSCALRTGAL